MEQQWPLQDHRSIGGPPISHSSSPAPEAWWHLQIFQALSRLETGQILNRKAVEQRVQDLRDHMDTRLGDLGHRIDRIEDRVQEMAQQPSQASTGTTSPATPPTTTEPSMAPAWWRDMSPKEAIALLLLLLTALGVIPLEALERIVKAAGSVLTGGATR